MAAYFQNLLVPGAKHEDVCDAICQWHSAAGFERQTGRLLFDYNFQTQEERVFVVSNEKGCLLVYNNSFDDKTKLLEALASFPAVIQLWAKDGAWGYNLRENGKLSAAYSKSGGKNHAATDFSAPDDLVRLAEVCRTTANLPELKRAQKARSFFLEKTCGRFAEALGAPLAIYRNFNELDRLNAGMTESRRVLDWHCQLLCFKKISPDRKPAAKMPTLSSLTPQQREHFHLTQSRIKWWMILLRPFMVIFWLLCLPAIGGLILLFYLSRIGFLRRFFMGHATCVCDDFAKKVGELEPKRIQRKHDRATNTRHGCSIAVIKPAVVCDDVLPGKGAPQEPPVFEIKLGAEYMSCRARRPGRRSTWGDLKILESRALSVSGCEGQFVRRRSDRADKNFKWTYYDWELEAPNAIYHFACVTRQELKAADFQTLENIVLSFKP